jgi:phosphoribosylformimino-5-aminoimidazole carboxamide ribotide isomerase
MRTIIIPAIDLMDGKCVRLTQGDYGQKKEYSADPVDMARQYEDC